MPPPATERPPAGCYDVEWGIGALGMRFTPNEHEEPVICQITNKASESVLHSPAAVGDVLVALRVHALGTPMTPVTSLQEMVQIFQHEELPLTLRFRSREHEIPQPIELVDIACSYTHKWEAGAPLGVSLAMDPCSLHAVVTAIDYDRIAPEFLVFEPKVGDILISVRDLDRKIDLDQTRFEQVISCLKSFPRPCKLTFARLHDENAHSPTNTRDNRAQTVPAQEMPHAPQHRRPSEQPRSHVRTQPVPPRQPLAPLAPPYADPRLQPRRPAPLAKRQSFNVDEIKQSRAVKSDKEKEKDKRFYKIMYHGGQIGIVLKDAKLELKGKPKRNGYYAIVKQINKSAVPGVEQVSKGDELIAIGQKDLQHMAFEDVQRMLSRIRSPTPLVFQRKPQSSSASGGNLALADALILFFV
ncbi:hypothetical protein Poli38472_011023 [Pythium oligandrum]|uniref:PDZ domain-containing protein n=1 Tax=Pythium oligandrum TaxID=41045 RepID=A0A8K1CSA3_PYTOL|nr:hypothetical protein Poli38472_011023 [Pythium oligandrum]|eukprot:TMW67403.1 hypothetical protein Poli38472_011023 [Pythium oligandrum]